MAKKIPSKRSLILTAVFISVIVYLAGVFSGLYANKIFEVKLNQDLGTLKSYVDLSAIDNKNIMLLQFYVNNIDDYCKFTNLYIEQLYGQLQPLWDKVPARFEEYERKNTELSNEYLGIKREYIRLSLRLWLLSYNFNDRCDDSGFYPILYFYSKDCSLCIKQSEYLEELKNDLSKKNITISVLPIDSLFYDDTSYLLMKYYNITSTPALILGDNVIQGKLISKKELQKILLSS